MSISVIVPTYKPSYYLPLALESVVAQETGDLEIILVDDASPEEYLPFLQELQALYPIRLVRREKNGGPAAAHNSGIAYSSGSLIAFLEHDDLWLPGKLRKQAEALADHSNWGACYVGCTVIDEKGNDLFQPEMTYLCSDGVLQRLLESNFIWSISSVMARRECLLELGCFEESFRVAADYDLWLRIAVSEWSIGCVPERLLLYRWHGSSASHSTNKEQCSEDVMLALERLRASHPTTWQWAAQNYARNCCSAARAHFRAGRPSTAREYYRKAVAAHPFLWKAYLRWIGTYLPPAHRTD